MQGLRECSLGSLLMLDVREPSTPWEDLKLLERGRDWEVPDRVMVCVFTTPSALEHFSSEDLVEESLLWITPSALLHFSVDPVSREGFVSVLLFGSDPLDCITPSALQYRCWLVCAPCRGVRDCERCFLDGRRGGVSRLVRGGEDIGLRYVFVCWV